MAKAASPKPPPGPKDIAKKKLQDYIEGPFVNEEEVNSSGLLEELNQAAREGTLDLTDLMKRILTSTKGKFPPELMTALGLGDHLGSVKTDRENAAWNILTREPTEETALKLIEYLEGLDMNNNFDGAEVPTPEEDEYDLEDDGDDGRAQYFRLEPKKKNSNIGEKVEASRALYEIPALTREKLASQLSKHPEFRDVLVRLIQAATRVDESGKPLHNPALRLPGDPDTWEEHKKKPMSNATVEGVYYPMGASGSLYASEDELAPGEYAPVKHKEKVPGKKYYSPQGSSEADRLFEEMLAKDDKERRRALELLGIDPDNLPGIPRVQEGSFYSDGRDFAKEGGIKTSRGTEEEIPLVDDKEDEVIPLQESKEETAPPPAPRREASRPATPASTTNRTLGYARKPIQRDEPAPPPPPPPEEPKRRELGFVRKPFEKKSFYLSRAKETLKSYINLYNLNPAEYVIVPIPKHLRNNTQLKSINFNISNPSYKYMMVKKSFVAVTKDAKPILNVAELKKNEDAQKHNDAHIEKKPSDIIKKYGKLKGLGLDGVIETLEKSAGRNKKKRPSSWIGHYSAEELEKRAARSEASYDKAQEDRYNAFLEGKEKEGETSSSVTTTLSKAQQWKKDNIERLKKEGHSSAVKYGKKKSFSDEIIELSVTKSKNEDKVSKVMKEFEKGTLHSGSKKGPKGKKNKSTEKGSIEFDDIIDVEDTSVAANLPESKHKMKGINKSLKDACWEGYEAIGMKTKNGKQVPNCVPKGKKK